MAKINDTTTKIKNRGNVVESPVGTFTWTPTAEVVIKTGILSVALVDAGSNTFDVDINFIASDVAQYSQTHNFLITICGDYKLQTAFLTTAVGAVISDSLIFTTNEGYESFKAQLQADASFEVEVPNVSY